MGEEYRSEVSKKGITDEEKNKIALKYKDKASQLYNTSFASEIQTQNQQNQVQQQVQQEKEKFKANIVGDIQSVSNEVNAFNSNEQAIVNVLKKYKTTEEFETFLKEYKVKTGKDFNKQMPSVFQHGDDRDEINDLKKHLNTLGYGITDVTETGYQGKAYLKTTADYEKIKGNTIGSLQGPGGSFLPGKTSDGTGFMQGPANYNSFTPPGGGQSFPTGFNTYTPPATTPPGGGQSFPTGFNTYTPPPANTPPPATTPPPGGETISNEKDITNQTEVVKVLNKIQSEAHSRGITMHTAQNTATTYIKASAEKLHYAKVAVEGTKMDSTKLVEKGIPSTQNLEQISIEMIKELQVANELLAGVFNNTQPTEGGIVLNLDGKKLATNFQNRMNNRQAFNNANRTRTNP